MTSGFDQLERELLDAEARLTTDHVPRFRTRSPSRLVSAAVAVAGVLVSIVVVIAAAGLLHAAKPSTGQVGDASAGPRATVTSAPRVRTVRCPTRFGVSSPPPAVRRSIAVGGHPRSVAGLVAYTNTDIYLIGPAGMACSGLVAADGGSRLLVWNKGQPTPRTHSHQPGLTLTVDPACAGCRAEDACPFFRAFARRLGFACTTAVPAHETVKHVGKRLVRFEDPPGVSGDGWPSGGGDPANGVVGITRKYSEVYRATCTLPTKRRQICTISLGDVIARYG